MTRIFNLAPHEVGRVAFGWSLRLFLQIGFTIGWTMLTAMLVNRLGINYLPLLFVANAGLTILSTALFSEIIARFPRHTVIYSTLISGAVLFGISSLLFSATENLRFFFALALIAEAVFFAQLNILIGLFIETLFSPLESERALPIVESAEYVGGIAGGLIILATIEWWHLAVPALAYFRGGIALLVFPLLWVFYRRQKKLPTLNFAQTEKVPLSRLGKIREGSRHIRTTPFLAGLLLVVLFQWTFATLLNYQYTKAVNENVTHGITAESGAHHENLLTEGLGTLHIIFSLLALATQFFLTSRIVKRLGIVRTLTLHPVFSLATSFGLFLKFGFGAAVGAKALFEMTTAIYTSAYLSSFYALRESVREHAKEFLEGLVRPLGVMLGTGIVFGLAEFLPATWLTPTINAILLVAALSMILILLRARNQYTHVSKKNLELFGNHPAKFSSVEILAQHGHKNAAEILVKNLLYKKESEILRIKILEALGRLRDPSTIPEILKCFTDPSQHIKLAAVNALAEFKDLGAHFYTQAFSRYRVISALEELFQKENSKEIRSSIVHVFANLHQAEVVPFLIATLTDSDENIRADGVYVCGLFHDISAAHYLEPHLNSLNPYVKANAIIALWQFPQYRLRLTIQLTSLLEANELATQKAAIHTLGEIGAIQELPRLERYLEHEDAELRLLAALALAKLSHARAPAIIADFLFHSDPTLVFLARKNLKKIPEKIRASVEQIAHHRLNRQMNQALEKLPTENLRTISPETLMPIRELYEQAEEWEEVAKIDAALAGKELA